MSINDERRLSAIFDVTKIIIINYYFINIIQGLRQEFRKENKKRNRQSITNSPLGIKILTWSLNINFNKDKFHVFLASIYPFNQENIRIVYFTK